MRDDKRRYFPSGVEGIDFRGWAEVELDQDSVQVAAHARDECGAFALVNIAVKVSLLIPPDMIDLKTQIQVVSLKSTELGIDSLSLGLMNIEHVLRVETIIEVGFCPARCIHPVLDIGESVWFSPSSSRRCSRRWPVLALF